MTFSEILAIAPSSKALTTTGLFFDLAGITILFLFQVDRNHALRENPEIIVTASKKPEYAEQIQTEQAKWKLYRCLTITGFLFLIVGFSFQIAGNLLN